MFDIKIYENFCNAIVMQAADDYRKVLRGTIKESKIVNKIELENFFMSDNIRVFTKLDGKRLMKEIQSETEEVKCKFNTVTSI